MRLRPLSDRSYFALTALIALAMISLALQWPQGNGDRAWGPFGHATEPQMRPSMASQAQVPAATQPAGGR